MDVDCLNFRTLLPTILANISSGRFVSIDLELSGIPRRPPKTQKDQGAYVAGRKQSLQQRYVETKAAAERFHILQFGLTCVHEDEEEGKYVLKPYNFHLSPLIDKRLKIERDFTFQSGAVDFLQGHQFRIDASFLRGVPHLSWELEAEARAIAHAEWDKDGFADISIKSGDIESFELMKRVRNEIEIWKAEVPQPDFISIGSAEKGPADAQSRGLNRYQKRLIHQLVRAEYPELTTSSRDDFVQLLPFDKEREVAQKERRLLGFSKTLTSQIGVRWILEAICQNADNVISPDHRSEIPSAQFFHDTIMSQDVIGETSLDSHKAQFRKLMEGKPMLVGHNLFIDLIYLFACFFGPLPDRVEEFQIKIATLFPLIIDTKYVADIVQENSPHYNSSLEGIDTEFSRGTNPTIEMPPEFQRYETQAKLHEAGYDSFLTARALIRLSSRLHDHTIVADTGRINASRHIPSVDTNLDRASLPTEATNGAILPPVGHANSDSDNLFSHLSIEETEDSSLEHDLLKPMMPPPNSSFWTSYGNKLRVNGTAEEVCKLQVST